MQEDQRRTYEAVHGYPCPRREWPDRDGPVLGRLVGLAASHGMGWNKAPLFELLWRVTYGGSPPEYEQRMAYRLLAAFNDEQVLAFLFPRTSEE